jgi:hypothetical protein
MFSWKRFKINRLTKKLLTMQRYRMHNPPTEESLRKEIEGYHLLAEMYHKLEGHRNFPFAKESRLAAYRAAAMIDDVNAQFILGRLLLDEGRVREEWEQGLFASQSNIRMMGILFEEALGFLEAAEKSQHVEAKRLRGLCYIHGWGVAQDQQKGFQMIVDSIQQENSWDKVPQIFAGLGLNKPEFFSQLTQIRDKTK